MSIKVPRNVKKPKKPSWLKVKAPGSPEYLKTRKVVKENSLVTVCEEAHCPNIGECWSHNTATFMVAGELCTRRCHFCAVKKGTEDSISPLDPFEPHRVGMAVKKLGLKHAVVTTVNRDDVEDNGAEHFAKTIEFIKKYSPECKVEFLISDLAGSKKDLETILEADLDVLNHNMETVARLYRRVRPFAGYIRSLSILRWGKEIDPSVKTKSGIMVGLGEKPEEVLKLMDDLRWANVDIMTIGQYLRPSEKQLPIKEFVTPEQFKMYEEAGLERGFSHVESGPLVRSSYHAWKHTAPTGEDEVRKQA